MPGASGEPASDLGVQGPGCKLVGLRVARKGVGCRGCGLWVAGLRGCGVMVLGLYRQDVGISEG